MAFYKQDIVDINLNTGNIFRSFLNHSIGFKNDDADRFGIRVFRDGEPVDLTGASCQAVFMNPNGTNIALTSYGTVSGNVAYVTLPQACYDYEGQFTLSIQMVGGGVTGTMRIVDGMVVNTGASGAVAPTASVPTYQEILAVYADMQEDIADYESVVADQDEKINSLKSALFNGANESLADLSYSEFGEYKQNVIDLVRGDVNGSNGHIGSGAAGFMRTDYIEIPENIIEIKNNFKFSGTAGWATYDSSKNFLRGGYSSATGEKTIRLKGDEKYIALTDYKADDNHSWIYIKFITDRTETITMNVVESYNLIGINGEIYGDYVFAIPQMIYGYVEYATGTIKADINGYARTPYIEIPDSVVKIETNCSTSDGTTGFAFFDSSKNYIWGQAYNVPMYVPFNAKYVVLSDYNASNTHTGKTITFKSDSGQLADRIDEKFDLINSEIKSAGECKIPVTRLQEGFYDKTNKEINDTSIKNCTYVRTDFIPIPSGAKSIVHNFTNPSGTTGGWGIFDEEKDASDPLSRGQDTTITVPDGAKFIMLTNFNSNKTHTGLYIRFIGLTTENENKWNGKTWVALGDSWTEGAYVATAGRYTDYVSEALGLTCVNLGVGGTGVATFATQSGKPLTQEIASSADLITIWGDINDMHSSGTPLVCGDITDTASASGSIMARWKYTLDKVLSLNPLATIVIIGCPICFGSTHAGYEPFNNAGDTIASVTQKIGELARYYGLPFIDMYHLGGFNSYTFNGGGFDSGDHVHPNNAGVKHISNIMIGELKKLQPVYE